MNGLQTRDDGSEAGLSAPLALAAHVRAPSGARHEYATVLFSDLVGFTEMTERLGDARSLSVIRRYKRVIREQVGRFAAKELELRGDGFLIALDLPSRALDCAAAIQKGLAEESAHYPDEPVQVRIGVHCGPVLCDESGYFGKTLIIASRIADLAEAGEVLASSDVRDLVRDDSALRFARRRHVMVKGVHDTLVVYRINDRPPTVALVPEEPHGLPQGR